MAGVTSVGSAGKISRPSRGGEVPAVAQAEAEYTGPTMQIRFHTAMTSMAATPRLVDVPVSGTMLHLKRAIASALGVEFTPDSAAGVSITDDLSCSTESEDEDDVDFADAADKLTGDVKLFVQVSPTNTLVINLPTQVSAAQLRWCVAKAAKQDKPPLFLMNGGEFVRIGSNVHWIAAIPMLEGAADEGSVGYTGPGTDSGSPLLAFGPGYLDANVLDAWELPFSSASFEMALAEDKAACLNSSLSLIQLII